ncbi:hypothetical protein F2Q68_00043796 [Brassica cretica]|uniref:Uncharacterized protein n=1 Tax=Brassica cretica TaxID=69181 RepID=A0A8S9LLI2_BRACR|nr:hypothetical protein F2Q68_00043796 [Brassica cretica]
MAELAHRLDLQYMINSEDRVVAPFSSYAAEFNPNRQITTPAFVVRSPAVAEKSCIFGKIKPFIGETLDFITREEEKKEDLVDWAKRLNKRRQI